jgi:hypothetical protein
MVKANSVRKIRMEPITESQDANSASAPWPTA